jgi:hypothetical protein
VSENELGRLHDLAVFLRAEEHLGTHLGELVERAASVTDAASCSIMLLSEGEASNYGARPRPLPPPPGTRGPDAVIRSPGGF